VDGDFSGDGVVNMDGYLLWFANSGVEHLGIWMLGDLNGDFVVDDSDAQVLVDNFGASYLSWSSAHANGDMNGDGHVGTADMDSCLRSTGRS
jgi:hypothetical protein